MVSFTPQSSNSFSMAITSKPVACSRQPAADLFVGNPTSKNRVETEYGFDGENGQTRLAANRGFTLTELIVVVAIITVVTSVVLASNSKYGGSVLLQNLAYDVALSVRQAQVYGISVRSFGASNFSVGYGMNFDVSSPISQTTYILFADLAGTGVYNPNYIPSENVPPSPYTIGRGYFISKLCAPAGTDSSTCTPVQKLDILYKRPEPDAIIRANGNSTKQSSGRIVLKSPRGDTLSVVVSATGQISVQ
jgi:prepilin-type N-terminal cleavage/methylation domain-containing protein